MQNPNHHRNSLSLEQVKQHLDQWRDQLQGKRGVIPKALWTDIIALLDQHPRAQVLRTLAISTKQLNSQLQRLPVKNDPVLQSSPDFMAIPLSPAANAYQHCQIELTAPQGIKLAIQLPCLQAATFIKSLLLEGSL